LVGRSTVEYTRVSQRLSSRERDFLTAQVLESTEPAHDCVKNHLNSSKEDMI
jgi:hypothetical protein